MWDHTLGCSMDFQRFLDQFPWNSQVVVQKKTEESLAPKHCRDSKPQNNGHFAAWPMPLGESWSSWDRWAIHIDDVNWAIYCLMYMTICQKYLTEVLYQLLTISVDQMGFSSSFWGGTKLNSPILKGSASKPARFALVFFLTHTFNDIFCVPVCLLFQHEE